MTRKDLYELLDRAGVADVYFKDDVDPGCCTIYVKSHFLEDTKRVVRKHRASGQVVDIKRLWFWHRWFKEKL